MFTLSSPPPNPSSFHQNRFAFSSPTSSFTSPPRYQNFAPLAPSPLRESRNAHNLPGSTTKLFSSPPSIYSMSDTENSLNTSAKTSPSSIQSGGDTTSISIKPTNNDNPFTLPSQSASTHFNLKSRSQSPQALLNKANTAHASARRALFFDRNRRSRDDKRFDVRSEQAMRSDFLREKREWEERMRRAVGAGATTKDIEDEDMEYESISGEQQGMSPPSDEQILEEQEREWAEFTMMNANQTNAESQPDRYPAWTSCHQNQMLSPSDDEGEDYDAIFMDVLSQTGSFTETGIDYPQGQSKLSNQADGPGQVYQSDGEQDIEMS